MKDLGNEAFKEAGTNLVSLRRALHFYKEGIILAPPEPLLSQLKNNAAAVFLKAGDYKRALELCDEVLEVDPRNEKALFRGAKAAFALGFFLQAVRFCTEGLEVRPDNSDFRKLQQELVDHYNKHGDPEFEDGLDPCGIEELMHRRTRTRSEAEEVLRKGQ